MPQFRLNVTVTHKGILLDKAQSQAAAQRMIIGVNEAIAQEAVNRVHTRLRQVLQNPTGYYQRNIIVERRQIYRGISDNGVVYGGWLERGRAGTRFRGYRTFRTVQQGINRDKASIAAPIVRKLVQELSQ